MGKGELPNVLSLLKILPAVNSEEQYIFSGEA